MTLGSSNASGLELIRANAGVTTIGPAQMPIGTTVPNIIAGGGFTTGPIMYFDAGVGAPYYLDQYGNKIWLTLNSNIVYHYGARTGWPSDLFGVLNRLMDEVTNLQAEVSMLKMKDPPPEPIRNVDLAKRIEADLPRDI
jgi:hypothetical protein